MSKTVLICDSSAMLRQAFEEYRRIRPTAVTIDIGLVDRDAVSGIRDILRFHPHAKIVVVSAIPEQEYLVSRAMADGAFADIAKPIARQQLSESLASCLA